MINMCDQHNTVSLWQEIANGLLISLSTSCLLVLTRANTITNMFLSLDVTVAVVVRSLQVPFCFPEHDCVSASLLCIRNVVAVVCM